MRKKSLQRFKKIIKVFAFYGFGYIFDSKISEEKKSPANLRKAFEELGPTFIKIGQILSTRTDILPEEYVRELSKLQDSVPSESFSIINHVFEQEFNKPIYEVFTYFQEKPLASASVAQVHEGILEDGREVVIKLQRPNIYEKMHLDISILMRIVRFRKEKFNEMLIDPLDVLQEILNATEKELDFKRECENVKSFRNLNSSVECTYAPYIVDEFSSSRVITMENIKGFKITDIHSIEREGYDRCDVAKKLALSYCKQIFNDGFFHGDPHPGNLLIYNNKICFIDFGLVGKLSKNLQRWLNEALLATVTKDVDKIINFIMSVGVKKGRVNRNILYEDIDYLFQNYLSTSLKNIKVSVLLKEIFEIAKRNNIQLPKELVLLIRGMVILEGVIAEIAPEMEILEVIIPFVKSKNKYYVLNKLYSDEFMLSLYNFADDTLKLPSKIVELSESLIQGRVKVNLQVDEIGKPLNQLNKMVNRLVFGIIVAAMIMGSSIIINSNTSPKIYDLPVIGITGYFVSGIFSLWLLVSIIRSGSLK
ncbi:protein kinase [Clostridium polyendosporum]|uniref:Protein kinase n=1 Tax=Clostridium polyendosporum TaxID=69208 RepID=A0A919VED1_9CLOT|nr:AarF/ABC1/UbiB kinase family protein [Clostridium polyendosporum]GIM29024.1 protein kinase [Clostridium polyendosporum]